MDCRERDGIDLYLESIGIQSDLEGWERIQVTARGEHVATLINKDGEIHYAAYPSKSGRLSLKAFTDVLVPLIDRYTFVRTIVPVEMVAQEQFVKRVGFRETRRDDHLIYLVLDRATLLGGRYA